MIWEEEDVQGIKVLYNFDNGTITSISCFPNKFEAAVCDDASNNVLYYEEFDSLEDAKTNINNFHNIFFGS